MHKRGIASITLEDVKGDTEKYISTGAVAD